MQRFCNLGLIETNSDHFFIIKENKLTDYLAQIAKIGYRSVGAAVVLSWQYYEQDVVINLIDPSSVGLTPG